MTLPDLPSGVYRHYKGPLYFVFGYGHDANAGELYDADVVEEARRAWQSGTMHEIAPLGDRDVVVYMGLELTDAHTGPRFAVRTAADFFQTLHPDDFSECRHTQVYMLQSDAWWCENREHSLVNRFTYVGPTWEGST